VCSGIIINNRTNNPRGQTEEALSLLLFKINRDIGRQAGLLILYFFF
jgi:hypothetical protein